MKVHLLQTDGQTVPLRYWRESKDGDPVGFALYRRHYSAKKNPRPKIRQFVGPGEKYVFIGQDGNALWAWRKFIDDSGQTGVNCAVFRNESGNRSSDMIREAMDLGWGKWPRERFYTYIDAAEVRSTNPGCCFKKAGWRVCGRTKKGQLILEAYPVSPAFVIKTEPARVSQQLRIDWPDDDPCAVRCFSGGGPPWFMKLLRGTSANPHHEPSPRDEKRVGGGRRG